MPASTIDTDALRRQVNAARRGDREATTDLLKALPEVLRQLDALSVMVGLRLDGLSIEAETRTDYGVQYGPNTQNVRWDPYNVPYTLDEARADAARNNLPLVTRQRTEHVVDDVETPWVPYEGV